MDYSHGGDTNICPAVDLLVLPKTRARLDATVAFATECGWNLHRIGHGGRWCLLLISSWVEFGTAVVAVLGETIGGRVLHTAVARLHETIDRSRCSLETGRHISVITFRQQTAAALDFQLQGRGACGVTSI